MSDFVELRPGMRLSIPDPEESLDSYYTSTVRKVDGRGVLIDRPAVEGEELSLVAGEEFVMFTQYHNRTFRFVTEVLESDLQVLVKQPTEAKRMERRSFYRLLITIPLVSAEVVAARGAGEPVEALIVDISGGGVRLRIDKSLPDGTRLQLVFVLNGQRLRLNAEVVHVSTLERRGATARYEAQCAFVDISVAEQDLIVRFIFEKQREFSSRGVA